MAGHESNTELTIADDGQIHNQLELFGIDELKRFAGDNQRLIDRIEAASRALESLDMSFMHSGFCMAGLPHRCPANEYSTWHRANGKFHLLVQPGSIIEDGKLRNVGLPYGARARLIMLWLQTEGLKGDVVPLGKSMSGWMRRLGLAVTGGERGTIAPFREQVLRLARAQISMHWDDDQDTLIRDQHMFSGLHLWAADPGSKRFPEHIQLTAEFVNHLQNHAVPLSDNAIAHLKSTSLGLDLYVWLAHRLPRLGKVTLVPWISLQAQMGSELGLAKHLALKIREVLPEVLAVYPGAKVESRRNGLLLQPSPPAVPRTLVQIPYLHAAEPRRMGDLSAPVKKAQQQRVLKNQRPEDGRAMNR